MVIICNAFYLHLFTSYCCIKRHPAALKNSLSTSGLTHSALLHAEVSMAPHRFRRFLGVESFDPAGSGLASGPGVLTGRFALLGHLMSTWAHLGERVEPSPGRSLLVPHHSAFKQPLPAQITASPLGLVSSGLPQLEATSLGA